jgi:hypothetical protein
VLSWAEGQKATLAKDALWKRGKLISSCCACATTDERRCCRVPALPSLARSAQHRGSIG